MIRVLIAEDSAVTREYLSYVLEEDPMIAVVGTARDGQEAVELTARLRPDVVLMDVHMPRLNGYEASRRIMEAVPTPIVMASASLSREEMREAFQALAAGALVLMLKPEGPGSAADSAAGRELVQTVKLMAEVKVVRRWPPRRTREAPLPRRGGSATIRIIAIGASTGGPQVIATILKGLPAELDCPVLLVQHIAADFNAGFASWLATLSPLPVKLAEDGEEARGGTIYVADGHAHMGLTRQGSIALKAREAESGFCPSISHLFTSVADACGAAAVGILLTGMGRDGADGLRRLRDAGALTIAQDAQSSAVFGMPAEAIRLDAAAHVLPPHEIVDTIRSLVTAGAPR